jgi:hypothetical protein
MVEYQSNSLGTGGQTISHRPWYSVNDLDVKAEREPNPFAAKGVKAFNYHEPKKPYSITYPNLDRVALQKQQKMTFLTNGSW